MVIGAVVARAYDAAMDLPGSPIHDPHLVGFDIETDTTCDGLDPETAAIVAVAVSSDAGDEVFSGEESDILARTDALLAEIGPGLLVTWNGASFDLPFVARRAEMLGICLGLAVSDDPARRSARDPGRRAVRGRWYRLVHLDGYLLYRADVGRSLGLSCGLKPLARFVGMKPIELDRTALHLASDTEISAYVASDARTAADLVRRRMPAAGAIADMPWPPIHREDTAASPRVRR